MERKELEQLIHEHELDALKGPIIAALKEKISLLKLGPDDGSQPGVTRVGGHPDLPAGMAWPKTEDGGYMTFLLQLNLSELHAKAGDGRSGNEAVYALFPKTGMLYFFIGLDQPAYNIEHKVLFIEDIHDLQPTEPPGITALEEVYEVNCFSPYRLTMERGFDVRSDEWLDEAEQQDEGISDLYDDFECALSASDQVGYLLGYAHGQHDDGEIEAALKILTGEGYDYYPDHARAKLTQHLGSEQKMAQEVNDTLVLLMLDSDRDVGFCWWDAGCLHFFIRKEDLLSRRFDRTYLSLESS